MLQARKGSSSSKLTKNSQLTTRQANNQLKQRLSQVKSTYRHLRDPSAKIRGGQTAQFLHQRKESNLNTRYNNRMKALLSITRENKKIHKRINSQDSMYSTKNINKSFESNGGNSRLSRKSRLTNGSKGQSRLTGKGRALTQPKSTHIRSKNIENIGETEMMQLAPMFGDISGKSVRRSIRTENPNPLTARDPNLVEAIMEEVVNNKHLASCSNSRKLKIRNSTQVSCARLPNPKKITPIKLPKIKEQTKLKFFC